MSVERSNNQEGGDAFIVFKCYLSSTVAQPMDLGARLRGQILILPFTSCMILGK